MDKVFDSEEFRRQGHAAVDFIADYYATLDEKPVLSQVKPNYLRELLPKTPPKDGEDIPAILKDVQKLIIPGLTHWQHKHFHAYFPAQTSPASMAASILESAFNPIGFSWICSPACTELELVMLDWMADALGLPQDFFNKPSDPNASKTGGGLIQGSASESTLVAVLASREKAVKQFPEKTHDGFICFSSDQAHSSLFKACRVAGVTHCSVKSDGMGIDVTDLDMKVKESLAKGQIPILLHVTMGSTSSVAFDDPEAALSKFSKAPMKPWVHFDAAYAGIAAICDKNRDIVLKGISVADSFVTNAHKWMLTNFDCSLFWVRDTSLLEDALSVDPEYLKNKFTDEAVIPDLRNWQIPLGRSMRSLKLWFVLRSYGVRGIQDMVEKHSKLASEFSELVLSSTEFRLLLPTSLGCVCFEAIGVSSSLVLERINSSGEAFMTHTKLELNGENKYVMRFVVCHPDQTSEDIKAAFNILVQARNALV